MSRSNMPTRNRFAEDELLSKASENAKLTVIFNQNVPSSQRTQRLPATVLLPTPPFPLATAKTFLTFGIDRF
jgi:hypothetical protein